MIWILKGKTMTKLAFENWISYFLGKMSLRPSNVEARKIVTKPKMWDGSYKGFSWAVLVNMISNLTGIGICVVSSTLNCLFSSVSLVCVCVCVCVCVYVCMCVYALSRVWLCNPIDYSPPGSSVHGIFPARILSGLPLPPSGDLPDPGIEPESLALAGRFFTTQPNGKSVSFG